MKVNYPSKGFSLIEVLIAVLVLAVGILGVASLQGNALRNTYTAHLKSQAGIIAQDMAERIRANLEYALSSAANYQVNLDDETAELSQDCAISSTPCNDAALATYDKHQWVNAINDTLPGGKGRVVVDANNRTATITVMWLENQLALVDENCTDGSEATFSCYTLMVKP